MVFTFVPTFRHFRLLNIIALVCTHHIISRMHIYDPYTCSAVHFLPLCIIYEHGTRLDWAVHCPAKDCGGYVRVAIKKLTPIYLNEP